MTREIERPEEEWRDELSPEQYEVLRKAGTEPAFSGEYVHNKDSGMYHCGACNAPLFSSDTKFESGTGWPSFYEPAIAENIETRDDSSHGMVRTEVLCRKCGSHLGHVFPDGPNPTGLRYCINSLALGFEKQDS
jgi:peptide-methionine (R)-S-oxide reductase